MKFSEALIKPFKDFRKKLDKDNILLFFGIIAVFTFVGVPLAVPITLFIIFEIWEWYYAVILACYVMLWIYYSTLVLKNWGVEFA